MSRGWTYNSGDWNTVCDSCGRKFKASQLKKRWDGLMVCEADWEPRHSLDFVRSRADKQTPPWIRPQTSLTFNHVLGVYETIPLAEHFNKTAAFNRSETEQITVSETVFPSRSVYPTDSITLSEDYSSAIAKVLNDTVVLSDYDYFAEDYLTNNDDYVYPYFKLDRGYTVPSESLTLSESIRFGGVEGLADSMSFSESGSITLPIYIDPTYFAADYMQLTQTF